jgi:CheY-like chemotaxis protein
VLERAGAKVTVVENGRLAMDAALAAEAQAVPFDVILMDMQMPVMDGYTATARLREKGYQGPIIALTAHAMKGDREKCEAAGCSGYLAKPVNMDELVRTVRQSCGVGATPPSQAPPAKSAPPAPATPKPAQTLRSTLPTDDPEIREVVVEFIDSISQRLDAMAAALGSDNFDELARIAHALKGSGGTAGFNCFTEPAARIEHAAKARLPENVAPAIDEIRGLKEMVAV